MLFFTRFTRSTMTRFKKKWLENKPGILEYHDPKVSGVQNLSLKVGLRKFNYAICCRIIVWFRSVSLSATAHDQGHQHEQYNCYNNMTGVQACRICIITKFQTSPMISLAPL